MGKTQRRNRNFAARSRVDPTGVSSTSHVDESESDNLDETYAGSADFLNQIGDDLGHTSSSKRQAAAVKFSSWLSEVLATTDRNKFMKIVNRPQFSRIISNLLVYCSVDAVSERYAMLNSLCGISSISPEACEELVSKDILTPLIAGLESHGPQTLKGAKWDVSCKWLAKSLTTITNVCTYSTDATNIMMRNSQFVINFLIECLTHKVEVVHGPKPKTEEAKETNGEDQNEIDPQEAPIKMEEKDYNYAIAMEAAKCLEVLLEEQIPDVATCQLIMPTIDVILQSFTENFDIQLTIPSLQVAQLAATCSALRFTIAKSLSSDNPLGEEVVKSQKLVVLVASKIMTQVNSQSAVEKLVEFVKKSEDNDLIYQVIRHASLSKQSALEVLCNVLCNEDRDEEEDMDEGEMECDDELPPSEDMNGSEGLTSNIILDATVINLANSSSLLVLVVNDVAPTSSQVEQVLGGHFVGKMVLELMQDERERCFAAISALLTILSPNMYEPCFPALVGKLNAWSQVLITSAYLTSSHEFIRTLSRVAALPLTFTQTGLDFSIIATLCSQVVTHKDSTLDFSVRCNAIHTVAKLSSKSDTPLNLVEQSSKYLMDILDSWFKCAPAEVTLEKLTLVGEVFDAIMDIFADDGQVNTVFVSQGILMKLKGMTKLLSQQIKFYVRKKELARDSPLADISANLTRFIVYKSKAVL